MAYVALLEKAGVRVTHHDEPATFHGYLNSVGSDAEADRALDRHIDWLRAALVPSG